MPTTDFALSSDNRAAPPPRRTWVRPAVSDLPRLTDLTLTSPIGGGGGTGGGGSTVF